MRRQHFEDRSQDTPTKIVKAKGTPESERKTMSASDDADLFIGQCLSLVGIWKGQGNVVRGESTIAPYFEECIIEVFKQTNTLVVLHWLQKTKHAKKKTPMHVETGLLKLTKSSQDSCITVEAGFTHPFPKGMVTELATGTFDGTTLHLTSDKFHRTNDSKDDKVSKYERSYTLQMGDTIIYTQSLDDEPHLGCTLRRAE